jgi:energy-coupling factor transporter ATP-binding protein EcfA2
MCAIKSLINPFEGQRWEQDTTNIIYLPEIFAELEKRQDLYLVGSRGTGKTTFLNALNWEIRLNNPSIHKQIKKDEVFSDKYIGIYINAMSFGDSIFERNSTNNYSFMCLYSLWAEINVLYRVLESIEGLYNEGCIDFTIKDEQFQCNKIYDYLSSQFENILNEVTNDETEYNITSLAEIVGLLRTKVIDERENLKWKSKYESYSIGTLIEKTLPNLMILCDDKGEKEWCTKICFDQIESAPNFQKIANTLVVKKISKKVWFIVSGLTQRGININDTYVPEHNLIDDDRRYIDLDMEFFLSHSAKRGEFYSLAEGICDLRLKHWDERINEDGKFDLTAHLGSWDANEILNVFLKHKETISVNKKFEKFLNLVRENHRREIYRTEHPPYIDTYYYDILEYNKKWNGDLQKSREKNSDTGKMYVVIMLNLLREYKFKTSTPYVGVRQIMSLCNTTRDFLKIMKALFDARMKQASSKNLDCFFSFKASLTQNEIEVQTKAVLNVANDKYYSIKNKYSGYSDTASKNAAERMRVFIDTCGRILYDLQAKRELSSLTSDEKGVFTVSFENNEDGEYLYEFLRSADVDTHIQILNESTVSNIKTIDFELSRLFAPKYKFSFRKTRNKIIIDGESLKSFCKPKTNGYGKDFFKTEADKLVKSVESNYQLKSEIKKDLKDKVEEKKSSTQKTLF